MKRTELSAETVNLALNAAEGRLQVVVFQPGVARTGGELVGPPVILSAHDWSAQSRGVEILAAGIRSALDILGVGVGRIGKIACARGPGSFTGLRLCIATAQGLARGVGAMVGGIEYPALLARSAFLRVLGISAGRGEDAGQSVAPSFCWVVTHARTNLVHIQGFELASGRSAWGREIGRISEIMVFPLEQAADLICDYSKDRAAGCFIVGSGLTKNRVMWSQSLNRLPDGTELYFETHDTPSAMALALEAGYADYTTGELAPLYVRPSDAEENIASIANGLGLDPKEAEVRLKTLTSGGCGS